MTAFSGGNFRANNAHESPGVLGIPVKEWIWTQSAIAIHQVQLPPGSGLTLHGDRVSSSIAFNRNTIVKTFLAQSQWRWLLFCDSDMVPPPDIARRLLAHGEDRDIIAAPYYGRHAPHYPMWTEITANAAPGPHSIGLREVALAGFGCVLLQRRVLEAMPAPWFEHPIPGSEEDLVFCRKAKALGFRLYLDPAADVGHVAVIPIDRSRALAWHDTDQAQAEHAQAMRQLAAAGGPPKGVQISPDRGT